jgi:hypothetical protein
VASLHRCARGRGHDCGSDRRGLPTPPVVCAAVCSVENYFRPVFAYYCNRVNYIVGESAPMEWEPTSSQPHPLTHSILPFLARAPFVVPNASARTQHPFPRLCFCFSCRRWCCAGGLIASCFFSLSSLYFLVRHAIAPRSIFRRCSHVLFLTLSLGGSVAAATLMTLAVQQFNDGVGDDAASIAVWRAFERRYGDIAHPSTALFACMATGVVALVTAIVTAAMPSPAVDLLAYVYMEY